MSYWRVVRIGALLIFAFATGLAVGAFGKKVMRHSLTELNVREKPMPNPAQTTRMRWMAV